MWTGPMIRFARRRMVVISYGGWVRIDADVTTQFLMSGRHPSRSDARHQRRDHHARSSPPSSSSSEPFLSRFEDKIATQQNELQTLLIDNQRLGATHVALRQELAHSRDEIERLKVVAARVKAERDAQVREVYERKLKVEAEARLVEVMREDLGRVRVDVKALSLRRQDMGLELKGIESEVLERKLKLQKLQKLPEVRAAVEIMRQEVERGRAAVENEKKMRASNQEQGKVMEKNMIKVCREIDRLRAALKDAEKKAAELNTPVIAANTDTGHAGNYGNSELKYNGNMHPYNIKDTQPTGTLHLTQFTASAAPTGPYAEQFNVQPHGSYSHQVNAHR